MRTPSPVPVGVVVLPTAEQSDASTQSTLRRNAPVAPAGVGLGTTDHDVPFQFSVSVPKVGAPVVLPRAPPTAQQSEPVTHVTSKSA